MAKLISYRKTPTVELKCLRCGAAFEADNSDIIIKKSFLVIEKAYINCPFCKTDLHVPEDMLYVFGLERGI